jgi:tetratricopeptide (TPR) repeat protein
MKFLALLLTFSSLSFAEDPLPLAQICEANAPLELVYTLLEKGSEFKKQGLWDKHIEYGEIALKTCQENGLLEEEGQLSTQLASTYFYRGNYERTKQLAARSLDIYQKLNGSEGSIASLYLLSAAERGLKHYTQAVNFAEQALALCTEENELKAKVLFNLAAALSDQETPEVARALEYLQSAKLLFTAEQDDDYVGRTVLRIGRLYLLKEEPQSALEVLQEGIPHFHQDRVFMHYHFLMAQALRKLGMEEGALQEARIAKVLSLRLDAHEDFKRIDFFLNEEG